MKPSNPEAKRPPFWRDPELPFIEAREVLDGRKVCYAKHSHETFSIGAIAGGRSTYLNGKQRGDLAAGALVIVNPEEVHACNPIAGEPWSYRMFYVDTAWLTSLQQELDAGDGKDFQPFALAESRDPGLYRCLCRLYDVLNDEQRDALDKHSAVLGFFTDLQDKLGAFRITGEAGHVKLLRAAEYISAHCTDALKLDDVCSAAELSPSHLVRAFKKHFGLTPHAYQVNRRIQYCRQRLRQGHRIADVALDAGFADQAHLQREFKRLLAATPGQYRADQRQLSSR